jgi:hypothetical protein
METNPNVFWKSAINNGILFGVILIILQVLMWMFNFIPVGIVKGLLSFVLFIALYVIALVIFTRNYRNKESGGFISYGKAFLYGLTVFFVATVLTAVYNYIFLLLIDPGYTERVMQATIAWTENFMRSKGVSEIDIAKGIDKIKAKPIPTALMSSLKSIPIGLIMGALVSLISSAFVKKEGNPLQETI